MSQIQSGILDQVRLSGLDVNERAWQATTGAAIEAERERASHSWSADGLWTTVAKADAEMFSLGLYDAGPRSGLSAVQNFYDDVGIQQSFAEPMDAMRRRDAQQRLIVNRDDVGLGLTSSLVQSARNAFNSEGKGRSEAVVAIYGTDDQGNLFDEDTLGKMFDAGSEYELANLRARALREREVAIRKQSMSAPVNFTVSFAAGFADPASLLAGFGAGAVGGRVANALIATEITPGIMLPGTASTLKNLAARGLIAGGENIAQGIVLNSLAGQEYGWHDAMRDMAFGAGFSTVFSFGDASRQSSDIRMASRRFKEVSELLSVVNRGAEVTDKGAVFFQHVPGFTKSATMLDIGAAEMVRVDAFDHAEAAGGGKSSFGWLVGRKATFDGIGEVTVTGIDGRDVVGTIDGREVRMGVNGVAVDRFAQLEPGTRVRLDDGTLGKVDTIATESTPFAEATRVPRRGDATTTVRVIGDDGKVHNLKPDELLARGGVASIRRGQVAFDPQQAGRAVIAFGKARDASTLAHETGHVFRRTLRDIDGELAAKIDEHYGQSGQNWTVDGEERFAKDFEQYMKEGKAPTKELASTFERFAAWLFDLWQSIGGDKSKLTDTQREAFGKILDSDQAKQINGELGGRYAATRESLRQVLGDNEHSRSVDSLMLANAKAWSRATGRNIDEYFESVVAGFTGSLRNPFKAAIRQLPDRTITLNPSVKPDDIVRSIAPSPELLSHARATWDAIPNSFYRLAADKIKANLPEGVRFVSEPGLVARTEPEGSIEIGDGFLKLPSRERRAAIEHGVALLEARRIISEKGFSTMEAATKAIEGELGLNWQDANGLASEVYSDIDKLFQNQTGKSLLLSDDTVKFNATAEAGELAQDALDLTDTINSEGATIPLGGTKGSGMTGGRGARVSAMPRIDRVGILKGMDHPLTNVITNTIFSDPLLDSVGKRGNASAEQFDSLHMHATVDGYLRQMHEHVTKASTAAGIGKINIPKRMKFEMQFREQVGKGVRDPNFTTTDANLKAAVETTRKTLRTIGQLGKDNFVKNFDKFALDDNYLTRVWDFHKLHEMNKTHTSAEVANLFEEAVHNQRPTLTRAEARVLGDALQKKLFTYGKEAGIDGAGFAAGLSNREYLLNTLKSNGVNEATSIAIADKVAIDKDNTSTISVAKRRTLLNEKASIRTARGETISIEDLLNNDSMAIVHRYGQQVVSEAAMTQVRRQVGAKLGVKWDTDAAMLQYMAGDMREAGYSVPEINKAVYLMDSGIKRLRGVALDDSGVWTDNAWRVRQFAALAGNGAFGIPAAFELGHAITRLGVRASLANMPAVLGAWKAMRKGEVNDPALKAMLYTIGIGHDTVSARYFGSWEHGTDPYQTNPEGRMAAFDKGLAGVAKASRFISGVPQITEFSRLMAANGVQHKLVQQALSGKTPSARRLAWLGMDATRWTAVADQIKANHKKGPGGLVDVQLDGGGWTNLQAKHDYIQAVRESVNTIIQEGGIGASHPWLESEAGKLIFQFRQFGIMAYNRQALAQYQIGDSEAIGRGMVAAVPIGAMQYMASTYLSGLGRDDRDEYFDKMLTPERLAIAAFSRASFSSIGPVIYDSFAATAGYETLGGFRASGLESDPLLGNPTFAILTSGRKGLGGGLRSMFDPNYDFSDDNIRGIRTVVPFSRLPGTSIMWNQILNQTPSHSVKVVDQ